MKLREGVPPDACLLLLARHAESEFNAQKRFCGRSEAALSALGHDQAQALARALDGRVDAVFASTQVRAQDTARALQEPALVEGIEELDQGELEGLTFTEAFARYPDFFAQWKRDPLQVGEPLGESVLDLRGRVSTSLLRLVQGQPRGRTLLVVGHQLAWASLLAWVRGAPAANWNAHALPNAGVARLWWAQGWCADADPAPFDFADSEP